jgi:hypothetical protein
MFYGVSPGTAHGQAKESAYDEKMNFSRYFFISHHTIRTIAAVSLSCQRTHEQLEMMCCAELAFDSGETGCY